MGSELLWISDIFYLADILFAETIGAGIFQKKIKAYSRCRIAEMASQEWRWGNVQII